MTILTRLLTTTIFASCLSSFAIYNPGDKPADKRWYDKSGNSHDLYDAFKAKKAVVLLHSAGWCGPCNDEMKHLPAMLEQFAGKQVSFYSISCDGWARGSGAAPNFLRQWEDKYLRGLKADWHVVASRDCGREYFSSPAIPNVVVIDADGRLVLRGVNPGIETIVRWTKQVLK